MELPPSLSCEKLQHNLHFTHIESTQHLSLSSSLSLSYLRHFVLSLKISLEPLAEFGAKEFLIFIIRIESLSQTRQSSEEFYPPTHCRSRITSTTLCWSFT